MSTITTGMLNVANVVGGNGFLAIIISDIIFSAGGENTSQKINVTNIFLQLDLNHNGKIEPSEVDDSLDGI